MQHAHGFRSFSAALHFFKEWPDQAHAAQLVLTRAPEIDGNLYFLLDPAAQLIEVTNPSVKYVTQQPGMTQGSEETERKRCYVFDARVSKHPLAATLLRRAMIEDTLEGAKSTRYK